MEIVAGSSLAEAGFLPALVRSWLAAGPGAGGAADAWRACRAGSGAGREPAPAWRDAAWREPWLAWLSARLPDAEAVAKARAGVGLLAGGEADVIVTGQQPGFLGGPLYTLLKIATAAAAAEQRSRAGRPTVPLFWCGADDDDQREAWSPVVHDPARGVLLRGVPPEVTTGRTVGSLPAAAAAGELAWLREQADRSRLAADLARIWSAGIGSGERWDDLQIRALLRIFRGTGLLVVSGDDPGLHRLAGGLYTRLWREGTDLAALVRRRGEELAAAGFHGQIADASLERPLNENRDDHRVALPPSLGSLPPAERIRPGVMLRSPVQDWLFAPAGVVGGPAEISYLRQLEPLYEHLEIPRAPVLPRLFATLLPRGLAWRPDEGAAESRQEVRIEAAADRTADALADALARALEREAGTDPDRARGLARERTGNWRKAIGALLRGELAREQPAAPRPPAWVAPPGRRQERALAALGAAALWGDGLIAALYEAAGRHLDGGGEAAWSEYLVVVQDLDGEN